MLDSLSPMRRPVYSLLAAALAISSLAVQPPSADAQDGPADVPPAMAGSAVSLLPPGNSGLVTADGELSGQGGGSYGDNLDDQTALYWGLEGYAGQGFADPADAVRSETLDDGAIRIYWDSFGVPAVYAETGRDVWKGVGYAIAQIRLFLMDAVRRQGRGTFAALVGPSGVPLDVQTKTLTYSEEEYLAIFEGLSQEGKDAFEGYVEGANAWIAEVNSDPSLLPVEYQLLSSQPEPLDLIDVLSAGVLITRTVAAEGGQEMDNVRLLRDLEEDLGEDEGRGVFTDLVWQEDPQAVVSVPREEGTFPNAGFADADAAFATAADYAATLPLELATGPGTGDFPQPAIPVPLVGGSGSGSGSGRAVSASGLADRSVSARSGPGAPDGGIGHDPGAVELASGSPDRSVSARSGPGAPDGGIGHDPGAVLAAQAGEALTAFAESLHGGSIGVAIGPSRTADGGAMLLSGPQLGYSYPSLLVELEVHGGGYDARGASVPALPTVGIGYTDRVAWALTTGYSKTIDSYIDTVRGTPGVDLEHRFNGEWVPASCRTETVSFREAQQGLPAGPAVRSVDVEVCRTVHGPIVSIQEGDGERLARSVTYQMFLEESQTVEGVLAWNRAKNLEDFEAAMRMVTWNENTTYADADGHIAYWHPGIHHQRPAYDLRFPMPGDGTMEFGERLPFEALPHAVDPAQGFLANWNNKPAFGWLDGIGVGPTSRPGGAVQRVSAAIGLASSRTDHTFQTLKDLEVEAGLTDIRAGSFVPLIEQVAAASDDVRLQGVALLLSRWNQRHYDPPNAPETYGGPGGESTVPDEADETVATDGPGATVFDAIIEALLAEVFDGVWGGRIEDADVAAACNSGTPGVCPDLVSRQLGVGGHRYDASPAHNLLLRVLDPSSSGLTPSRDYLAGRSPEEVIEAAITTALDELTARYGSEDLTDYRRTTHRSTVNSLTGVTGPSSTQPYMDRGSYIHVAAFDGLAPLTAERAAGPERVATSVAASTLAHADGAETVVIAAAGGFTDALLAAPLTGLLSAPLLLVDARVGLAEGTLAEISRLGAAQAVVVGSETSVPESVIEALTTAGLNVRRLGGADAFEVGAAVAADVTSIRADAGAAAVGPDAYIVSAEAFPDAVTIAGVAARTGTPVLFVTTDAVPPATSSALEALGATSSAVIGGTAVVSETVASALPGASRLAGPERYATGAAVIRHARALGLSLDTLVLATGANFPDSLSGGGVAAALDGVVVLVDGLREDPGAAYAYAASQRASVRRVVALGGTAVISDELLALVR